MTDAFVDVEEEKTRFENESADLELARRLQEAEFSDDVEILGSTHSTPTAHRSLNTSNDFLSRPNTRNIPIEVSDDDGDDFTLISAEPQPPSRFQSLQQRVRDIANLVRNVRLPSLFTFEISIYNESREAL